MTCKSFFPIDLAVTIWHDLFPREGNLTCSVVSIWNEKESTTIMWETIHHLGLYSWQQLGVCSTFTKTLLTSVYLFWMAWSGHDILEVWAHAWVVSKETYFSLVFLPLLPWFPLIWSYFEQRPEICLFPSTFSPSSVTTFLSKDGSIWGQAGSKSTRPFPHRSSREGVKLQSSLSWPVHFQGWLSSHSSPSTERCPPQGTGALGPVLRKELGFAG